MGGGRVTRAICSLAGPDSAAGARGGGQPAAATRDRPSSPADRSLRGFCKLGGLFMCSATRGIGAARACDCLSRRAAVLTKDIDRVTGRLFRQASQSINNPGQATFRSGSKTSDLRFGLPRTGGPVQGGEGRQTRTSAAALAPRAEKLSLRIAARKREKGDLPRFLFLFVYFIYFSFLCNFYCGVRSPARPQIEPEHGVLLNLSGQTAISPAVGSLAWPDLPVGVPLSRTRLFCLRFWFVFNFVDSAPHTGNVSSERDGAFGESLVATCFLFRWPLSIVPPVF